MAALDLLLSSEPQLGNIIGKFIYLLYQGIGNFGWTVVVFTLILKTVMFPLDYWQKALMRKNNKIMQKMKPQLDKLQKQCGGDKMMLNQKTMELYKKEGYSTFGACLPTIVTLALFFVVFAGFRATVTYHNEMLIYNMTNTYHELKTENKTDEEITNELNLYYEENIDSWLWVKNVFMPDTHSDVVPSYSVYSGSGMGKINASIPDNLVGITYDELTSGAALKYNKTKFWDVKNWNGYYILPLLSMILSIVSQKTMKMAQHAAPGASEQQQKTQESTMKMMQYMMPIMIGVFSLFYSAAFSIYMFVSSLFSSIFQIIYNAVTKKIDAKEIEQLNVKSYRR